MNPITKMLIDMAKFYAFDLEKRQVELYTEVLSQFPVDVVIAAGKKYILNPKNSRFPVPPHSIMADHLGEMDPRTLAVATVGRIKEAIAKYGWPKPSEARAYIGEDGWRMVERSGGWQAICERPELNVNDTSVHAQMRDAIESDLKLGRAGFDMDKPLIEQSRSPRQLEKSDFTKLVPIPEAKPKE